MDISTTIKSIVTDLTARLTALFNGPEGALQALAVAGAVVIILLFVLARRQGQATQLAAASEPVVLRERVEDKASTASPALDAPAKKTEVDETSAPAENSKGFVFHHRKPKEKSNGLDSHSDDPEIALSAIEQEMLATRQLFLDGVISKDVYLVETRSLYGKAQQHM
jgi:hypothetical protein